MTAQLNKKRKVILAFHYATKNHIMKTWGTSALDEDEYSASCSCRFTPGETDVGAH
jgi:hypothetical protein